jgi:hypothetical protein
MRLSSVVVVACTTLGVGAYSGDCLSQDRQSLPVRSDPANPEKRLVELERRLASVLKDIQELRRDLQAEPPVVAIPVKNAGDVGELARLLRGLMTNQTIPPSNIPTPTIEAARMTKCVVVRGNADQIRTAKELIGLLDVKEKKPPTGQKPAP